MQPSATGPEDMPELTPGLLMGMINLFLLTELSMRLGLDEDGSATTGRALRTIGMLDQIAPTIRVRPRADPEDDLAVRRRLRTYLRSAAPLMSRLARPVPSPAD